MGIEYGMILQVLWITALGNLRNKHEIRTIAKQTDWKEL